MPVLFVAPTARKAPGFVWVTVTVSVLDPTVTPIPAGHVPIPIAAATLEAKVVVLPLVAKVPVKVGAAPLHAFEPLPPAITEPHARAASAPPTEKVETLVSPGVLLVAVTALVLEVALTPAAALHALIAAARLVAKVVVLLLVINVPVKVGAPPLHPVEPLPPAVGPTHEKLLRLSPTENVVKVPGVVSVAVTAPRPFTLAVSPTAEKAPLQLVIAAATFEATPAAVAAVVKVPATEVVQLFVVPLLPVVTPAPQSKMPALFDAPTAKVETPWSPGMLTVTVLPLALAVKPTGKVVWQLAL